MKRVLRAIIEVIKPYIRIKYITIWIILTLVLWIPFGILTMLLGGELKAYMVSLLCSLGIIYCLYVLVKIEISEEKEKYPARKNIIKRSMMIIVFTLWMMNLYPIIVGLLFSSLPMWGNIIDSETEKPIKDAIMVNMASNDLWGLIQGSDEYLKSKETCINKRGEYYIGGRIHFTPWTYITPGEEEIIVYAKGYVGEIYISPSLADILSKLLGRYNNEDFSGNRRWWKSIWTLGHRDIYLKPLRTKEEAKYNRFLLKQMNISHNEYIILMNKLFERYPEIKPYNWR